MYIFGEKMRISGPFHIEKKGHEGGARLKSGPFYVEKKVTRGGAGEILLKSEQSLYFGLAGLKVS